MRRAGRVLVAKRLSMVLTLKESISAASSRVTSNFVTAGPAVVLGVVCSDAINSFLFTFGLVFPDALLIRLHTMQTALSGLVESCLSSLPPMVTYDRRDEANDMALGHRATQFQILSRGLFYRVTKQR